MDAETKQMITKLLRSSKYKHAMCDIYDDLGSHSTKMLCTQDYIITGSPTSRMMFVIVLRTLNDKDQLYRDFEKMISECNAQLFYMNSLGFYYTRSNLEYTYSNVSVKEISTMRCDPVCMTSEQPLLLQTKDIDKIICNVFSDFDISESNPLYDYCIETIMKRVSSSKYYGIQINDKLVSQLYVNEVDNDVYIEGVLTLKEFRGRGLSRQLLEQVISVYGNTNKTLYLNVEDANKIAIHIYNELGFYKVDSMYCLKIMS